MACFYNAPLQICICICADCMRRALTLRTVGWGGRMTGAVAMIVCMVYVCVLKGGHVGAFTPPDKAGHCSQMVVCSLRPCVCCAWMCV